tara:strand:+ start:788 stop:1960 length:1173 start_codon:yes stop_codon:yes gene_type:complete
MMQEHKNKMNWPWWPLFPLYPYGTKKTINKELVPNVIWSFEQLQGLYYVAVPIRMTVLKVDDGLMLINPIPPTEEVINEIKKLTAIHGQVKTIVLPTSSGLEHKIGLPALARYFEDAEIWLSPGQWSFPINLPLSFIGIPKRRTRILFEDGLPFEALCDWSSLGPIDLGLGRFQEVSCFHKPTGSLIVTDSIIGIDENPPDIFDHDPTPLLFHSRDRGDEQLIDTNKSRKKGWARLVLFSIFLKPNKLKIPSISEIYRFSFYKGLRNIKSHFGIYPFLWQEDWEKSAQKIIGKTSSPIIQIAPVLQKLILPRSVDILKKWLELIKDFDGLQLLISAHYSAPIKFTRTECEKLIAEIDSGEWDMSKEDSEFLSILYKRLFDLGIIPKENKY